MDSEVKIDASGDEIKFSIGEEKGTVEKIDVSSIPDADLTPVVETAKTAGAKIKIDGSTVNIEADESAMRKMGLGAIVDKRLTKERINNEN